MRCIAIATFLCYKWTHLVVSSWFCFRGRCDNVRPTKHLHVKRWIYSLGSFPVENKIIITEILYEMHWICLYKDNTVEEQNRITGMCRTLIYRLIVLINLFNDLSSIRWFIHRYVVVVENNIWNNLTILFPRTIISKLMLRVSLNFPIFFNDE